MGNETGAGIWMDRYHRHRREEGMGTAATDGLGSYSLTIALVNEYDGGRTRAFAERTIGRSVSAVTE